MRDHKICHSKELQAQNKTLFCEHITALRKCTLKYSQVNSSCWISKTLHLHHCIKDEQSVHHSHISACKLMSNSKLIHYKAWPCIHPPTYTPQQLRPRTENHELIVSSRALLTTHYSTLGRSLSVPAFPIDSMDKQSSEAADVRTK